LLNKRTELKLREDNKNNINIIGLEEANVSSSEEFI
jgi:kinesin family member 2/24